MPKQAVYNIVFLSLGSNLGKKEKTLKQAVYDLQKIGEVKQTSSFFYSKAEGGVATHDFVNMCLELHTKLSAEDLLKTCQNIENKHGRTREKHWGNRTLDIDILTFNNENIHTKNLQIPHPLACERDFVLMPLQEITEYSCENKKMIIERLYEKERRSNPLCNRTP